MHQQAVIRFCKGAANKEAGSYAFNIQPKNIEEAIDKLRLHQHNHQAIYGRPPRTEVKQISPRVSQREARICVIGANRVGEVSLKKEMEEVLFSTGEGNERNTVQPRSTLGSNGGHDGGG